MATRSSGDERDPIGVSNGGGVGGGGRADEAEARGPFPAPPKTGDFLGKHRLNAAINRLNQEIQNLQDELDELETTDPSSASCKDTPGPENAAWERWFQRVRGPHSSKWWMHKGSSDVS